ncbi:MAG: hypothetical protein DLM68_09945 [Hyphomicrobiales bacterium]|nr:MAG: hypothetical protein DLM68_09945 [Hyphomicrobiales bacterium]
MEHSDQQLSLRVERVSDPAAPGLNLRLGESSRLHSADKRLDIDATWIALIGKRMLGDAVQEIEELVFIE